MWRYILRRLAFLLVTLAVWISPVSAQNRPADRLSYSNQTDEERERGPPVLEYTLALLALILIMLILCMPSRKRVVQ